MNIRIALCGAPQVGKTTLLTGLVDLLDLERPLRSSSQDGILTRIDIKDPHPRMTIITISGSFLYGEGSLLPWLVTDIHAIIYVIASISPHLEETSYRGARADERARQHLFWKIYTDHAAQAGSMWTDIPWLCVLNTYDTSRDNPLRSVLPSPLIQDMIVCNAITRDGLPALWTKLSSMILYYRS